MSTKAVIGYIIGAIGAIFWTIYQLNSELTRVDTTQKMHMESDKVFVQSLKDGKK